MAQPQYEEYMKNQLSRELASPRAISYTREQLNTFVEELESKYTTQIMSLKLEAQALKAENDRLWKIFVEKLAEERISNRMKELNETNKI